MVKTYSVNTRFSNKQLKNVEKGKAFTHSINHENEGDVEMELNDLSLKDYNKFKRMKTGKNFRIKNGDGIFDRIRGAFNRVGNTLKNTFSEKNAKNAVKVVVPGMVGGLTGLAVGTAGTVAGANPIVGTLAGSAAGAVTNKLTKDALDKSLGSGIRKYNKKDYTGDGLADMFMSFISNPNVQKAGMAAGAYLGKKAIDAIVEKLGRSKVNKAKELLDKSGIDYENDPYYQRASDYYKTGLKEQERYKNINNDFQSGKLKTDAINQVQTTVQKKAEPFVPLSFGNGVVGYGKGVVGYSKSSGKGIKKGGVIPFNRKKPPISDLGVTVHGGVMKPLGTITESNIKSNVMQSQVPLTKLGSGVRNGFDDMAEQMGAISTLKNESQFRRMEHARSFRKK